MDYISQLPSELVTLIIHYITYEEIYININILSKYWCNFLDKRSRDINNNKIIYNLSSMKCDYFKFKIFQIKDYNFKYLSILEFIKIQFNYGCTIQISNLQNLSLLRFTLCIINQKLFELTPKSLYYIKYHQCDVLDINNIIDSRYTITKFEFEGKSCLPPTDTFKNIDLPITLKEISFKFSQVDFGIFSKLNKLQNLDCSFCTFCDKGNEMISMPSSLTRLYFYAGIINSSRKLILDLNLNNCYSLKEFISDGVQIANLIADNFPYFKKINSYNVFNILTDLTLNNIGLINIPIIPDSVKKLDISCNQITSIKIFSDSITDLNCSHNMISQLDITYACNIQSLDCSYNELKELDTSNLKTINCRNNQLIKININSCLEILTCNNNNLRTLRIPSGKLKYLEFTNNFDLEIYISAKKEMKIVNSFFDNEDIDHSSTSNEFYNTLLILQVNYPKVVKYIKY